MRNFIESLCEGVSGQTIVFFLGGKGKGAGLHFLKAAFRSQRASQPFSWVSPFHIKGFREFHIIFPLMINSYFSEIGNLDSLGEGNSTFVLSSYLVARYSCVYH